MAYDNTRTDFPQNARNYRRFLFWAPPEALYAQIIYTAPDATCGVMQHPNSNAFTPPCFDGDRGHLFAFPGKLCFHMGLRMTGFAAVRRWRAAATLRHTGIDHHHSMHIYSASCISQHLSFYALPVQKHFGPFKTYFLD
ncbi:predicted protein [Plenodomus lingam JN3]|uniref:Predicted protein n=1 Tax=Leptosphaeria maculans (strain JN3 / isolate v23.1.3 / race Av1-4-5-6-7-8) TaxID=985895 RepID=E4ZPC5_LEPMJ|nr:predicted protein [Plenodomus lingam JN3]CBX93150.1 predicted protein [Plenodomus lingam JN3]